QQFVAHAKIQGERTANLVVVLNVGVEEEVFIALVSVGTPADRRDSAGRARVHAGKRRRQSLQKSLQRRESERAYLRGGEIDVVSNLLQHSPNGVGMRPALEEYLIGELPLIAAVVAPTRFGAEATSAGSDAQTRKR